MTTDRRTTSTILGVILGTISALVLLAGVAHAQAGEAREEFHQTYALAAGGRVELSNINGDVNISAWEANEVKIDAVKHARNAEQVSECKIIIDARPDYIRVETKYPEHNGWFGHSENPASVEYTIKVPRTAKLDKISAVNGGVTISGVRGGVHVSAVNGKVNSTDIAGPIDLSSVNSPVEAAITATGNDIRMHSVNGRVNLTVPSDTQAEVTANTVNGSIHNEFGLGIDKGKFVGAHLKGRLGSGTARIDLKTVNGSIDLRHANDGKPLSKSTDLLEHGGEPI